MGTFCGAGNGDYPGELRRAVAAIQSYLQPHHLREDRALLRLDGQYGTGAVLSDLKGLAYVMRGKDYTVLDRPEIQAHLHLPPDQQLEHPESGICPWALRGSRAGLWSQPILPPRGRAGLARRYPLTREHGRHSTPVEVIVRLLVVKQLCQWSYQQTVEQVSQRLELRWLCRIDGRGVPTESTLLRWAQQVRPETEQVLSEQVRRLLKEPQPRRSRKASR